jgi:predicted ATP-dependent endonuclease of OLD family
MILKSIHLINFQCFKDSGEIPINDMTIFIGKNDSGKSSILKALDIFLSANKQPSIEMFHKINNLQESTCSITLTFEPDQIEIQNLSRECIINNKIIVRKEFFLNENDNVQPSTLIKRYLYKIDEFNHIHELKAPQLKDLCTRFDIEYGTVENAKSNIHLYVQESFNRLEKDEGFGNIKWSEIAPILPIFECYDSADYGNPQKIIEVTLRNIYRSFFFDFTPEGGERLKEEMVAKKQEINEALNRKIEESLKEKVQSKIGKLTDIRGDYFIDFSAGFQLNNILIDFGQGLNPLNGIGEGSKKRLLLAILEWDREIRSRESQRQVIRGYDEPDASLHYSAQKEIYYTLENISKDPSSKVQVIICTHSLPMIDRAPARKINHIVQQGGISHIDYLNDYGDEDIKDFLDNVSEISGIKNSSLFFERCFLVVEGDTEENALPEIYKKMCNRSILEDGIVLVNLRSNACWDSFLKLLNRNKSEATILFLDKDTQSDKSRRVTPEKLKQINFSVSFLNEHVILVGNKEFEDIFSNELISKCLNKFWPKVNSETWDSTEIEVLRTKPKFSNALIDNVNHYMYDHYDSEKKLLNKPELGKRIAETAANDELNSIPELIDLKGKIAEIIK